MDSEQTFSKEIVPSREDLHRVCTRSIYLQNIKVSWPYIPSDTPKTPIFLTHIPPSIISHPISNSKTPFQNARIFAITTRYPKTPFSKLPSSFSATPALHPQNPKSSASSVRPLSPGQAVGRLPDLDPWLSLSRAFPAGLVYAPQATTHSR